MALLYRADGWVKNSLGQAIAGAQIYICLEPADTSYVPPVPLASIFADSLGLVPITQPISTDGFGHYDYYAASGVPYTEVVVNGGITQQVYPDQVPMGAILGSFTGDVTSVFGRFGAVVSQTGDYSFSQISGTLGFSQAPPGGTSSTFWRGDGVWATPAGGGTVTSVFGRIGAVVATSGDYGVAQVTGAAPTASPAFTGTATIAGAHITGTLADGTNSVGTSGQVLSSTVTGTLWVTPSGGSGSLVLLESHTASNSAELDFTTSITATYDDYLVEVINIVPASNGANIYFQASTNGGSSYDTGSNYGWAGYRASSSGSAFAGSNSTTGIELDTGATITSTASAGGLCGSFRISNPLSGVASTRVKGEMGANDGSSSFCIACMVSGAYVPTTAVNAFRILASTGNLTSGTVRVYGFVT